MQYGTTLTAMRYGALSCSCVSRGNLGLPSNEVLACDVMTSQGISETRRDRRRTLIKPYMERTWRIHRYAPAVRGYGDSPEMGLHAQRIRLVPDVVPASQASPVSRSRRHGAAYLLGRRRSPACRA